MSWKRRFPRMRVLLRSRIHLSAVHVGIHANSVVKAAAGMSLPWASKLCQYLKEKGGDKIERDK